MGYGSSMKLRLGLLMLGIAFTTCAPPQQQPAPPRERSLQLVAGELGGLGTLDGNGQDARFSWPAAVVTDGAGILYVADQTFGTIRKIVPATGEVTTLALKRGGTPSGVLAPAGLALDGAGNLYVASPGVIHKVVLATSELTTLAGRENTGDLVDGIGGAARFRTPCGMVTDGAGNLYVVDELSDAVRKVVLSTGEVTTFAGKLDVQGSSDGFGTDARFSKPQGLSIEGGSLYVADTSNHVIRKVVLATTEVTTLAGTPRNAGGADGTGPKAQFLQPTALAADGLGNLYVADTGNQAIRVIDLATTRVTTLAGTAGVPSRDGVNGTTDGIGTDARFYSPRAVAADGAGHLYVADTFNHVVRRIVTATGRVSTLAGRAIPFRSSDGTGADPLFGHLTAVATDGAGNAYVTDNHAIRKVVLATGEVTTLAGSRGDSACINGIGEAARFYGPSGLAWDGADTLYVADRDNRVIRTVSLSTAQVGTLAGSAGNEGSGDGIGPAAQFKLPRDVALDGAGNLLVTDAADTVRKVVLATRAVTTLAGTPGMRASLDGIGPAARLNQPQGAAADATGNLYFADSAGQTIRKLVVATGQVTTLAGTALKEGETDGIGAEARFRWPWGLALAGAGALYVSELASTTLRRVDLSSGAVTTVIGLPGARGNRPGPLPAARLADVLGVAVTPTGEIVLITMNAVFVVR